MLLNLVIIDLVAAIVLSTFVQVRVVNWIAAVDAPPASSSAGWSRACSSVWTNASCPNVCTRANR